MSSEKTTAPTPSTPNTIKYLSGLRCGELELGFCPLFPTLFFPESAPCFRWLEEMHRLQDAATDLGSYFKELHSWVVFAHETGNFRRDALAIVWNEAPEIEAFGDCPITVAGLAKARSGTRHAALIPTECRRDGSKGAQYLR